MRIPQVFPFSGTSSSTTRSSTAPLLSREALASLEETRQRLAEEAVKEVETAEEAGRVDLAGSLWYQENIQKMKKSELQGYHWNIFINSDLWVEVPIWILTSRDL
jgi:hypothetical protein